MTRHQRLNVFFFLVFLHIGTAYATKLRCVPSPSIAERALMKSAKLSVVDFEPFMDSRDVLIGPLCMSPAVIPMDAAAEAESQGCILRGPSVDLGPDQKALWLCSSRSAGEVISSVGYWGDVAYRKPAHSSTTVCTIMSMRG